MFSKTAAIFLLLPLTLTLASCESQEKKNEKKMEKRADRQQHQQQQEIPSDDED